MICTLISGLKKLHSEHGAGSSSVLQNIKNLIFKCFYGIKLKTNINYIFLIFHILTTL